MKILNLTAHSIFLEDIGYSKNNGPKERHGNQARYVPTGLDNTGTPDTDLAIQLVETGAVKMSAAKGEIANLVGLGKLEILSVGENIEKTMVVTKTGAPVTITQKFWDDLVFGRPVLVTGLKVQGNQAPATGKTIEIRFLKNNVAQSSATFDWADSDGASKTFDVSAMTFAAGTGNAWAYNDKLDLEFAANAGDTAGLTSVKMTLTFELVD